MMLIVLASFLTVLSGSPNSDPPGCECVFVNATEMPMTEFRLQVYDAIFIGHVVKVELLDEATWGDWAMRERRTEFIVMRPWKGLARVHERITLKAFGSTCDYPFRLGETYLVFAEAIDSGTEGEADTFTTDICDPEGTRVMAESIEQIQALDALVKGKGEAEN